MAFLSPEKKKNGEGKPRRFSWIMQNVNAVLREKTCFLVLVASAEEELSTSVVVDVDQVSRIEDLLLELVGQVDSFEGEVDLIAVRP